MSNRVSIAAVACVLLLCLFTMGQSSGPNPLATPLRVEYMPHPRDCVQIKGGTPYIVPAGRILSLTSVQRVADYPGFGPVQVLVDGQPELLWSNPTLPLPLGFTAQAGLTVTLLDTSTETSHPSIRAWGYLAAQ